MSLESEPGHNQRGSRQERDQPGHWAAAECQSVKERWDFHSFLSTRMCSLLIIKMINSCFNQPPDRWTTVVPRVVELNKGQRARDSVIEMERLTPGY